MNKCGMEGTRNTFMGSDQPKWIEEKFTVKRVVTKKRNIWIIVFAQALKETRILQAMAIEEENMVLRV